MEIGRIGELRELAERADRPEHDPGVRLLAAALREVLDEISGGGGNFENALDEEPERRILVVMKQGVSMDAAQIGSKALLTPSQMTGALDRLCKKGRLEPRDYKFGTRYVLVLRPET